jgi:hypothetical protein
LIVWPESLVAEVAERRCAIVLGAGASMGCLSEDGTEHPKNWPAFLNAGISRMSNAGDKTEAKRLLRRGLYLDAAQVMVDALGPSDFGTFITDELVVPRFQASRIHELIVAVDPKLVITTNYDDIYESYARSGTAAAGYNVVRYYESHFVNDLRSRRPLIVKVHGCVSNPQKVVLTRRQYFDARRSHPQFFAALDAVFLTHTLLFIGSGFSGDPDIELLLQNAYISAPSEHPHYAIVEQGRHSSVRRAIEDTHNIKFLEYSRGQHPQVVDALETLNDLVDSFRALRSS